MNFKFKNNLENNFMTLEISVTPRRTLKEDRKRIKFNDILSLINESYSPPSSHTLGECVSSRHVIVDNDDKNALSGKWVFSLVPKKVLAKAKATTTRKTKKTTTTKA